MKKIIILFFLVSCATTQKYRNILSTWLGSDINELISVWGVPSNQYKMPNENTVYTWLWVGKDLIPSHEYETTIKKLAFDYTSGINWCRTSFTADKNYKIINFTFDGSRCKAK